MRTYRTEINPSDEQKQLIHQTIGVCRYLYNLYIATNQERHKQGLPFMSGMEFDKWINNVHSKIPGFKWIRDVSSKARKKSIMNAETAYNKFFKKLGKFPRFKKKRNQDVKIYFPRNNKTDWTVERHRVKVPTLGFVRLKEKGYIPTNTKVTSGTVLTKAGRYYVSVLVEEETRNNNHLVYTGGIGVDLGIKDYAIVSNGITKPNVNKTIKVKKLEKKLKREQRRLSKKYENRKKRGGKSATKSANIEKQILKVQKLHQKLDNIRSNYVNQTVRELLKIKPGFVTIEDLNVRGMMKNRHLSKTISKQNFYSFRVKLTNKCKLLGIELRVVSRFYPSSKLCACCGNVKKELRLSDRVYICKECGYENDRDINAAINLRNAKEYTIAS